jgi:type IV pilus assembly protein PilF
MNSVMPTVVARPFARLMACALPCLIAAACVSGPGPKEIKQAEIQYDLGVTDLREGKLQEALSNLLESARINPDSATTQFALGSVYYLLGDFEQSIAHFQKALEFRPDYHEARANLGRVYISQKRFQEAIPMLEKALEYVFLPERYLAESNLGWAKFQIGEHEEGFKLVRDALAKNETYCVGYEYLGLMYQARKDYEHATAELSNFIKYCPQAMQGYLELGKAQLMKGDDRAGCSSLDTCRRRHRMTAVGQECERLYQLSCAEIKTSPQNATKKPSS